jgi:Zn-dependent M16 (insulinase) family peptidase
LESAKGDTFSGAIITDFLYGPEDGSGLEASMDDINQFAELRKWTNDQWTRLLKKYVWLIISCLVLTVPDGRYYIDAPSIVVRGKPSANMAEKLEKAENARITTQIEELGPSGLKKAEEELDEAKAEHDRPIPSDLLTSFPVPDVKSISWIAVQSLQERGKGRPSPSRAGIMQALAKHVQSDGTELPFFVQYDHVQVRM